MPTTAETCALPHEHWAEANLILIVAAECLASGGPVPASLLPLAMCLQVSFVRFGGPPSTHPLNRSTNAKSPSGRVALTPCDPPIHTLHIGTGISARRREALASLTSTIAFARISYCPLRTVITTCPSISPCLFTTCAVWFINV